MTSWRHLRDAQELGERDGLDEYYCDSSSSDSARLQNDKDQSVCNASKRDWERSLPDYKCILEHVVEDYGWHKEGWFVLVNYNRQTSIIANFMEESYFSSQTGMECQSFVWQGATEQLVHMAKLMLDPRFPERGMLPDDFNYEHWRSLYEGICAWVQVGRPDWSSTSRWGPGRQEHIFSKTPFATNMTQLCREQSQAATIIQAAWRGWSWRLSVLWNPHSVIGARWLAAQAAHSLSLSD